MPKPPKLSKPPRKPHLDSQKLQNPKFHIQSGALKGLRLLWNESSSTRPTKALVRKSFFDTLQSEIRGAVFIEGFGGCGSMGIEALSLGASEAVFCEIDPKAFRILQTNLALAQKRHATQKSQNKLKFHAYNADFFTQDFQGRQGWQDKPIILYLDPPFSIREGMGDIYERLIAYVKSLEIFSVSFIVFEHWSEYNMPLQIGRFTQLKSRRFGKSTLTYYTY